MPITGYAAFGEYDNLDSLLSRFFHEGSDLRQVRLLISCFVLNLNGRDLNVSHDCRGIMKQNSPVV
jgi:hypothetical protein